MGDDDKPLSTSESQELSDIRTEVSDPGGANYDGHWRDHYRHSEVKQARYQSLLEREGAKDAPREGSPKMVLKGEMPSAEVVVSNFNALAPSLAADVEARGAASAVAHGQEMALSIFGDIGVASAENLSAMVDALPRPVQAGIFNELTNAYIEVPNLPTNDFVETFRTTSAGRILNDEWGEDLPRRLSRAVARMHRLEADLDEDAFASWQKFWKHGLNAAQRASALRHMSK
jgi:hypothetical protein